MTTTAAPADDVTFLLDLVKAGRELIDLASRPLGRVAEFVFLLRDPGEEFVDAHAAARTSPKAGPTSAGERQLAAVAPVSRRVIRSVSAQCTRATELAGRHA